jgi:hypothetical protein
MTPRRHGPGWTPLKHYARPGVLFPAADVEIQAAG